jgi:hypothetical protein
MGQSGSSKRSRKRPTLGGDVEEVARGITRLLALEVPALRQPIDRIAPESRGYT